MKEVAPDYSSSPWPLTSRHVSPGYWRDYLLKFLVIVSCDPTGTKEGSMELISWFFVSAFILSVRILFA